MAKTSEPDKEAVLKFLHEGDNAQGFEQISSDTMAVPFLRILQPLSPQVQEGADEYIEGAKPGMLFNTVAKIVYGSEIKVIALRFERVFIEWRPNREGFKGYHSPENAERITVTKEFGAWKTSEGNNLQENYVYMLLIVGHEQEGPLVMSLASSMIKTAREWNRLMITQILPNGQRALPWYMVWNLSTEMRKSEKGMWYVPIVRFDRYIDETQAGIARQERKALPARQVDYAQIEHAGGDAEKAANAAGF